MEQQLTKARARTILDEAREDIALLLTRRYEDIEEAHRLLAITAELYVGITGEEAPAFVPRLVRSA